MSQADELLNSLTETAVSSVDGSNIVIGADRFITVPESLKKIGVQYDHNIQTVTFDCPRYWDGRDLSKMRLYVNYMRADGVFGMCLCENLVVDDTDSDIIHFDWMVSGNVTHVSGALSILVCAKKEDADGNEENHWNSELNTDLYVSEGMKCQETILRRYPDIITQLLTRMESVEEIVVPTVSMTEIEGGHRLTMVDTYGTYTMDIMDGAKGDPGEKGDAFTYEDFTPEQLESLKGEKGADGTMSFEDLTEEQKASLKGDPGEDAEILVTSEVPENATVWIDPSENGDDGFYTKEETDAIAAEKMPLTNFTALTSGADVNALGVGVYAARTKDISVSLVNRPPMAPESAALITVTQFSSNVLIREWMDLYTGKKIHSYYTISTATASDWTEDWHVNPNLLDNWYFLNPVNQRVVIESTGAGYTVDRWYRTSYGTLMVDADGIQLVGNNSRGPLYLRQFLENPPPAGEYTMSALVSDVEGEPTMYLYYRDDDGDDKAGTAITLVNGLNMLTLTDTRPITRVQFTIPVNACVTLKAAKLELGSHQTLAHQDADGNWVLNEIPDYGEQLLKCQRYYRSDTIAACTDSNGYCTIQFPKMRATPTVTVSEGEAEYVTASGFAFKATANTVYYLSYTTDANL